MEKANEYAVDSLKHILTLASGVLALTITFVKDILGENAEQASFIWLVPAGWVCLLVSIWLSWIAIVDAADALGDSTATNYVFKSNKKNDKNGSRPNLILRILSWFVPIIPTKEQNLLRKLAACAQNYFVLGLLALGIFAVMNLGTGFKDKQPSQSDHKQKSSPIIQTLPDSKN